MRPTANYWIEKLTLTGHIEGGYFKENYRSPILFNPEEISPSFKGERNFSTSIYFLLKHGQFSAFHRIASDEQWHFYFGDPLIIYEIKPDGTFMEHLLGNDPDKNEHFQCVISAGSWFASAPAHTSEYCLVGCTVAPGFDFADFELAKREELAAQFPAYAGIINLLTAG